MENNLIQRRDVLRLILCYLLKLITRKLLFVEILFFKDWSFSFTNNKTRHNEVLNLVL